MKNLDIYDCCHLNNLASISESVIRQEQEHTKGVTMALSLNPVHSVENHESCAVLKWPKLLVVSLPSIPAKEKTNFA